MLHGVAVQAAGGAELDGRRESYAIEAGEVLDGAWPMAEGKFFTSDDTEAAVGARFRE